MPTFKLYLKTTSLKVKLLRKSFLSRKDNSKIQYLFKLKSTNYLYADQFFQASEKSPRRIISVINKRLRAGRHINEFFLLRRNNTILNHVPLYKCINQISKQSNRILQMPFKRTSHNITIEFLYCTASSPSNNATVNTSVLLFGHAMPAVGKLF